MRKYAIQNAITNTPYSAKIPYYEYYVDDHTFAAHSDAEAIRKVNELQSRHDAAYIAAGARGADYENAPYYLANLYEVFDDWDFEDRKVEL